MKAGDIIFLYGEVGVGKTTFVRFFINYLEKKNNLFKITQKNKYGRSFFINGNIENIKIKKFQGKKLSYNNYNDIFSALLLSKSLPKNIGTVIIPPPIPKKPARNPATSAVDIINNIKKKYSLETIELINLTF